MNHLSSKVLSLVCGSALLFSGIAFGAQAVSAATAAPSVSFTAPAADQVAVTWPIGAAQIVRWTEKDFPAPVLVSLSLIPVAGGNTYHMSSFNAIAEEPALTPGGGTVPIRVLSRKITLSSVIPADDYYLSISISTKANTSVSSQSKTIIHVVPASTVSTTCDGKTYSILTPNSDEIWKVGAGQRVTGCGIGQMTLALYNDDASVSYPLHALLNSPTSNTASALDWNFSDSFAVPKTVPPGYYRLGLSSGSTPIFASGSVTVRSGITNTPAPAASDLMLLNPTTTDATTGNWYQDQIAHVSWSMTGAPDDGFRVALRQSADGPELYILKEKASGHSLAIDPSTITPGSYVLVVSAFVHGYATQVSAPITVAASATPGTPAAPYLSIIAPTGVTTVTSRNAAVNLSWKSNVSPTQGYGIYLINASGGETFLRRVLAKHASFSFANAVPGAYTIRIRAAAKGVSVMADSPVINVVDGSSSGIPSDSVIGYRDSLSCGTVGGWACIPGQQGGTAHVRIVTDSGATVFSSFVADTAAPDASAIAAACTGGDGSRRFARVIPASLKDGLPHTLVAQAQDATGVWRTLTNIGSSTIQCGKNSGTTPASPTPKGVVESATCDSIAGWACDASKPLQTSEVRFSVDGTHTFRASAAYSRADLVSACGSAEHGFTTTLPNSFRDGQTHHVTASVIYSNGKQLALDGGAFDLQCSSGTGHPVTPPANPPAPAVDARVIGSEDSVSCSAVHGWACLPGRGGNPASVRVVDENGKVIRAAILANDAGDNSDDSAAIATACGGGNGSRRYTFSLPASLADGATHSVIVQGRDLKGNWTALPAGVSTSLQCVPKNLPTPPASTTVHGVVDGSACTGYGTASKQPAIFGWACDPSSPSSALKLRFYKTDGTAIAAGVVGGDTAATSRPDLIDANVCAGTGNHGFTATFPRTYKGQTNSILVYAVDPSGKNQIQIGQATLSCASVDQNALAPSSGSQVGQNAAAIGDSGANDPVTSFWKFLWQ